MSELSRRHLLRTVAAITVGAMLPSVSQAVPAIYAPVAKPQQWNAFDFRGIVQRLDVFLIDQPSERELRMSYSGPAAFPNYPTDHEGRIIDKPLGVTVHDKIGDVVRRCGGEADWEATAKFREPWYARMEYNFQNPSDYKLKEMAKVWNPDDLDMMVALLKSLRESMGFQPSEFQGPLSDDDVANDSWEQGSQWPLPLLVTKCGHRFWMCEDKWVVDVPRRGNFRMQDGYPYIHKQIDKYVYGPPDEATIYEKIVYGDIEHQIDKYAYGPPDDATWPEKIAYGLGCERFEVSPLIGHREPHKWSYSGFNILTLRSLQEMEAQGVDMKALYEWSLKAQLGWFHKIEARHGFYAINRTDWGLREGSRSRYKISSV